MSILFTWHIDDDDDDGDDNSSDDKWNEITSTTILTPNLE